MKIKNWTNYSNITDTQSFHLFYKCMHTHLETTLFYILKVNYITIFLIPPPFPMKQESKNYLSELTSIFDCSTLNLKMVKRIKK